MRGEWNGTFKELKSTYPQNTFQFWRGRVRVGWETQPQPLSSTPWGSPIRQLHHES